MNEDYKEYEDSRRDPKVFEELFDEICVDSSEYFETEEELEQYYEALDKRLEVFDEDIPIREPYGKRWLFKNGYGISVIRKYGSYGVSEGLFEVGIIKVTESKELNDDDFMTTDNTGLCYDTPLTDDVISSVDSHEVKNVGERVRNLDKLEVVG